MDDLDRLIAGWGRGRRLPEAAAVRIRTRILTPPVTVPVLPAAWWRSLGARTSQAVLRTVVGRAA